MDHDELLRRITGRRISPAGRIYNIYTAPPKNLPASATSTAAAGTQRSDDTEDVFEQRMKTFYDQTAPVIDHYRRQGRFVEVDGSQSRSKL